MVHPACPLNVECKKTMHIMENNRFKVIYNVFYIFIEINTHCCPHRNKSVDPAFCPDVSIQIILTVKTGIDLYTVFVKWNCHPKYSKCQMCIRDRSLTASIPA